MESLQSVLLRTSSTIEDVRRCMLSSDPTKVKLTVKARKKLLTLISSQKDDITKELLYLAQAHGLVESLTSEGPQMASICDKLLKGISESIDNEENTIIKIVAVDKMLQESPRLKLQVGTSVFQYIFPMFSKGNMSAQISTKLMKLLVTTLSHCRENRAIFGSRADARCLNGIFDYITNTFDPMGQAYAAEFLWRCFMAMKERKTQEEVEKIFGEFSKPLLSITTDKFCEKIHDFLKELNTEHRNIYSLEVKKLVVGGKSVTLSHSIDIGDSKIIIWITKGAKWTPKAEACDLISLKKEDILGIDKTDENHWCIVLDEHFDTLSDCFLEDQNKAIFFDPVDDTDDTNDIFQIVQSRFGSCNASLIPYKDGDTVKKKTRTPKTPKPVRTQRPTLKIPEGSKTPKVTNRKKSNRNISPQIPPQTPSVASLHTKDFTGKNKTNKLEIDDDLMFLNSESDSSSLSITSSLEEVEIPAKPKANVVRKFKPLKREIKQRSPISPKKESVSSPKKVTIKKEKDVLIPKPDLKDIISSESDDELDEIPAPSFSQQIDPEPEELPINQNIDDNSDDQEFEEQKEEIHEEVNPPPRKSKNEIRESPKKQKGKPKSNRKEESDEKESQEQVLQIQPVKRTYAPDRWELEVFEELKSFSNVVRNKLSEKHTEVDRIIDDSSSKAVSEINSFMQKCDQDLERIRSNFIDTSAAITTDITAKQNMVKELGDQQKEHIDQMQKDCINLQKRAQEMVKRFEQQKKQLIQNQEKHISLFREDIRSEVKTAVTKKRREYSKNKVQKLVSLLEEL